MKIPQQPSLYREWYLKLKTGYVMTRPVIYDAIRTYPPPFYSRRSGKIPTYHGLEYRLIKNFKKNHPYSFEDFVSATPMSTQVVARNFAKRQMHHMSQGRSVRDAYILAEEEFVEEMNRVYRRISQPTDEVMHSPHYEAKKKTEQFIHEHLGDKGTIDEEVLQELKERSQLRSNTQWANPPTDSDKSSKGAGDILPSDGRLYEVARDHVNSIENFSVSKGSVLLDHVEMHSSQERNKQLDATLNQTIQAFKYREGVNRIRSLLQESFMINDIEMNFTPSKNSMSDAEMKRLEMQHSRQQVQLHRDSEFVDYSKKSVSSPSESVAATTAIESAAPESVAHESVAAIAAESITEPDKEEIDDMAEAIEEHVVDTPSDLVDDLDDEAFVSADDVPIASSEELGGSFTGRSGRRASSSPSKPMKWEEFVLQNMNDLTEGLNLGDAEKSAERKSRWVKPSDDIEEKKNRRRKQKSSSAVEQPSDDKQQQKVSSTMNDGANNNSKGVLVKEADTTNGESKEKKALKKKHSSNNNKDKNEWVDIMKSYDTHSSIMEDVEKDVFK